MRGRDLVILHRVVQSFIILPHVVQYVMSGTNDTDGRKVDLRCNECDEPMRWGEEYQLDDGTDFDALCSDCYHGRA